MEPRTAAAPAAREHRFPRFSLGTVVVAGSMGALAMLGGLTATGALGSPDGATTTVGDGAATSGTLERSLELPDGVVPVRVSDGVSTTFGTGLVINAGGDVVTTLDTSGVAGAAPGSTGTATAAIGAGATTWASVVVVGTDIATGLSVLHPVRTARLTGDPLIGSPRTSAARLGTVVDMVRPGVAAIGAGFVTDGAARITSTNTCLDDAEPRRAGLLTLTSPRPTGPSEVGVDAAGAVTALVLPDDPNPEDEMYYGVPADLALRIGRQIETSGRANHGRLDAALTAHDGTVTVADVDPTSSLFQRGDELLAVDGRQVHSSDDVDGALLGSGTRASVGVVVRRDNRQIPLDVPVLGATDAPVLVSSTTLP